MMEGRVLVHTSRMHMVRAVLGGLVCGFLLIGSAAGLGAQPPTPPSGQPSQPPSPPSPEQPFVPTPGVPPQTLPPQKVAEVTTRGNEHIPTDRILEVVSTKVNDPLNEEKLRNDVQAILSLGDFADVLVRVEPVPEGVRVVFLVVENPVVTGMEIKGNTVVPTPEITEALGVSTGQVLNTVTMRNGARAVEKLYQDHGYVLARVADVSVDANGVLAVTVAEGKIEAINIEGLQKTKDYVVRRELSFKPGDVFNSNAVNASLRRLFQLQYFSDVRAQPGTGTQPDTVDVTLFVTEQRTAVVSLGGGFSTVTGIQGLIAVRETDLGGNGQVVGAQYNSTALNGNNFAFSFHEPFFLGSRTAFDAQGFNQTTIPTDFCFPSCSAGLSSAFQYNMLQSGGSATFTQPLDAVHSLSYGGKSVSTAFGAPTFGTPPPLGFAFTPGTVNAVLLGAVQDTRNDPTFPTDGDRIELTTELALQTLGGSFTFQKYELDYTRAFPSGPNAAIVGHAHVGAGSGAFPIQEQFYLGSQTSLRGYVQGRFRGDEMVLMTGEYRFPLSSLPFLSSFTGITAILFVDAGDAEPFGSTSFTLKSDYGLGLAVKTAIGLFRIDYGISNEGSQLWISTGGFF